MKTRIPFLLPVAIGAVSLAAGDLPPAMAKTWSEFQVAVKNHDVNKIASLSHFPIKSEWGDVMNSSDLKRMYNDIFPEDVIDGIRTGHPALKKHFKGYVLQFNSELYGFGFVKYGDVYLFSYIKTLEQED